MLNLQNNHFKSAILNMVEEFKETVSEEQKASMRKISYQIEDINKNIEIIKTNQIKNSGVESTIIEIENSLESTNSKSEKAASVNLKIGQLRLSSLRKLEKKKTKENEQSLRDLCDSIKHTHIQKMEDPEGEKRVKDYLKKY